MPGHLFRLASITWKLSKKPEEVLLFNDGGAARQDESEKERKIDMRVHACFGRNVAYDYRFFDGGRASISFSTERDGA